MFSRVLWVALLWPALLFAEVSIKGPDTSPANKIVRLEATGDVKDAGLIWDVSPEDAADVEESGTKLYLTGPAGVYKVKLRVVNFTTKKIESARLTVTIGPAPGPTPDPGPGPGPGPAPIPGDGLRLLIVYETASLSEMPAAQRNILSDRSVRDYLKSKCAKDSTAGDGAAWRMWDKDVDASGEAKQWQDALARAKADPKFKTPFLLLSNGKAGYQGALPATVAEMLALLKKYEGSAKRGK